MKAQRAFTLLELVLVISIVAILAGVFMSRIPYYQEQAEKAAMEQVAGALQSALVMRYGALMARGATSEKDLSILVSDNPMDWLQQKPKNYAGEYYDPAPNAIAPGQWVFDLKSRELLYVVDHGNYFTPGKDGKKWVRYHIRLLYEATSGGGAANRKEVVGTLIEPDESYRWLN